MFQTGLEQSLRELDAKLRNYEHMGVTWYAVYDPMHYLTAESLTIFALERSKYRPHPLPTFGDIGLGLMLWEGEFEGVTCTWLRWCDRDGTLLMTGQERATAEAKRATALAAKLRELGVDPDSIG